MNTLDNLNGRRSCRKYQDKLVPEDVVAKIIEAGTNAASGKGLQSPIILAVMNKELRDKLSKINGEILGIENDPFYGAPQVLVVLADKSVPTYVYDGSLVMGNMMTAAEELGVDSCWINRARQTFDREDGKQILKDLGIEGDFEGIGNLVIGYDDGGKREKAPRKENYVYWVR